MQHHGNMNHFTIVGLPLRVSPCLSTQMSLGNHMINTHFNISVYPFCSRRLKFDSAWKGRNRSEVVSFRANRPADGIKARACVCFMRFTRLSESWFSLVQVGRRRLKTVEGDVAYWLADRDAAVLLSWSAIHLMFC